MGRGAGPRRRAGNTAPARGPAVARHVVLPDGGTCGRRVSGERVRSGHAAVITTPVVAAGRGVRHGRGWALRSASFRRDCPISGGTTFGIAISRGGNDGAATALVDVLAGLVRPAYGELRVLGEDLTTARGRDAVRGQVGVARRLARPQPAFRVRGLVEHAARLTRLPRRDRDPLTAAIVDRLSLTAWPDVPLPTAPDLVCRRARRAPAPGHPPAPLPVERPRGAP